MSSSVRSSDPLTEEELREVYESSGGVVREVAREFDLSETVARTRLIEHGIHESTSYESFNLEDLLPHEVGLSHFKCGHCRCEIQAHPCGECGWLPGETQSTFDQFAGGDD